MSSDSVAYSAVEITSDGVFSIDFQDWYFSVPHGLAESRYVYCSANGLDELLAASAAAAASADAAPKVVRLAELGFGTGLNCACTLQLHKRYSGSLLHYIGIDMRFLHPNDLSMIANQFAYDDTQLRQLWQGLASSVPKDGGCAAKPKRTTPYDGCQIDVYCGDVLTVLAGMAKTAIQEEKIDIWYLDGFSPGKNPAMWGSEVLQNITRLSKPGSRCSSFTAAGWVRRGLAENGWQVERRPGFGRKRHMTVGVLG